MKRKICVVTGSRAEYGLLKLTMRGIKEDPDLILQIIATGMHLSPTFGLTFKEIEADGFEINHKVECLSASDTPIAIAEATGKAMAGCAKALDELKPDLVLVLGDRFEIFGATTAALLARIPIAHIHGGEVTVGSYDEAFRHSITKMSSIHFVATAEYCKRVIQLGENSKSVHLVGGLGVDAIKELKLLEKYEIEEILGFKFGNKSLLVTFHPATLENIEPSKQMSELLKALSKMQDTTLIFTMPNTDTGGLRIIEQIKEFINRNSNAFAFNSLGQHLYLSCMASVDGVVGNSSSGILEAPALKIGTINIGDRQMGRIQAPSIINSKPEKAHLIKAIKKLFSADFQIILESVKNPYGDGGASSRIINILRSDSLDLSVKKKFHDL